MLRLADFEPIERPDANFGDATGVATGHATAGFTLIEALVALAIVAAGLAAIGSLIATTIRNVRGIDAQLALIETARAIEAGLPERSRLEIGTTAGELAGYRWRVDVLPGSDAATELSRQSMSGDRNPEPSPWTPLDVVIRVQAPTGQLLQLNTVRLRPRLRS